MAGRVTQDVAEILIGTTSQSARVTQMVIEVLVQNIVLPLAPTDCAAVYDCATDCVTLIWTDNAVDETGYIVEVSLDGGAWSVLVDDLAPGTEFYLDCAVVGGANQYRVRAFRNSYYSDPCITATIDIPVFWSPTTWTPIVGGPRF